MNIKSLIKEKLTRIEIHNTETAIVEGNQLADKIALVVGGSGGIGGGIVDAFIRNGCRVVISGTNTSKMKELCDRYNGWAKYVSINLKDVGQIRQGITEAISCFGRIDIFVHAAGSHGIGLFSEISEEVYDEVMDVNLKSVFFTCQEISNYMIRQKIQGHILLVGSASCAKPAWTPYEISKWGVRGFTLGLADTLVKHGIVVNSIDPGPVATRMIGKENTEDYAMPVNPAGRMATVNEVANLAVFMCSSAGDMIIGDTFFISGGSGTIKISN